MATPVSKEKKPAQRYFSNKWQSDNLRDRFIAGRTRRPRELCWSGESCLRFVNLLRFSLVCSASLVQALVRPTPLSFALLGLIAKAPWMLSTMEIMAMLLVYFLAVSKSLLIHQAPESYKFSYRHSLEDVVGISCARAAVLAVSYAAGMRCSHRPYLYASYLLAGLCFPYIAVKAVFYRYTGPDALPAAIILSMAATFCWLHVLAARRSVEWARRRYQMGLAGFGYPWEEGEDAWMLLRRPDLEEMTKSSDGGGPEGAATEDVPPETLADDDSKFVEVGSVKIHYKEAIPGPALRGDETLTTGIVLVHGFGGGVFAWRHVLEPLAAQCQCRVVAFDRPAFGLTSRPKVQPGMDNPYAMGSQAELLLRVCAVLHLKRIVVVAHADGCLLALRAASIARSRTPEPFRYRPPASPPFAAAQSMSVGADTVAVLQSLSLADLTKVDAGALGAPAIGHYTSTRPATAGNTHESLLSVERDAGCWLEAAPKTCTSVTAEHGDSLEVQTVRAGGMPDVNGTDAAHHPSHLVLDMSVVSERRATFSCHPQHSSAQHMSLLLSTQQAVPPMPVPQHRRCKSLPGPCTSGTTEPDWFVMNAPHPKVLGLVLLHPNLSGQMGPALTRLLARSKLGRSILRPLLRTEVGEVSNRRAWHNAHKLTPEVLELYKAPLRVEGWDSALMETTRLQKDAHATDVASYVQEARSLPALVVTGEHDRIVPPSKLEHLCGELQCGHMVVLRDCGHLSHEEAPCALLAQLVPFCGGVLVQHRLAAIMTQQQGLMAGLLSGNQGQPVGRPPRAPNMQPS